MLLRHPFKIQPPPHPPHPTERERERERKRERERERERETEFETWRRRQPTVTLRRSDDSIVTRVAAATRIVQLLQPVYKKKIL
jgi:hypothetical protein